MGNRELALWIERLAKRVVALEDAIYSIKRRLKTIERSGEGSGLTGGPEHRQLRCIKCGYMMISRSSKPRCSKCNGSRFNVVNVNTRGYMNI